MFGNGVSHNGQPQPVRPPAGEVAKIQGGGLTQVIVSNLSPITYAVFLNGKPLPPEELDTLVISVTAPEHEGDPGEVQATLSQKIKTVMGEPGHQQLDLFPGTVELVALGRRILVSSTSGDSIDGIWINLGLKPDGSSSEVNGAKALRIVLNQDLLSAQLTWNDGASEEILPQGSFA